MSSVESPTAEKPSLSLKDDVATTEVPVNISTDISRMTEKEKQALYRKLDWHLLPILITLVSISVVDQGNIGNALSLGLIKDLRLDIGARANIVTSIFYVSYFLFQVPSQIMLKLTSPSKWIPTMVFAWGIVMTLSCLAKTYNTLLVARFFLGITEAGLIPGTTFYISIWYPRAQIARRTAYMLSTANLGLAWGGILAYGIAKMEGIGGLHGWAWIFCLEGTFTCIIAVLGFIFMHDYPERANFLNEKERAQLLEVLREDANGAPKSFEWKYLVAALVDWKVYVMAAIYLGVITITFDVALFLPTIIKDLGFGAANAQLLLVPPHILGWPITVYTCILSDRVNLRGPFLMAFSTIGMIGFGMLRSSVGTGVVGYVAVFFATSGIGISISLSIAWIATNAGGELKRAATLGIVFGLGSLGGIISSFTYRTKDAPRYQTGHGVALGMLALIFTSSALMSSVFWIKNKAKIERCKREKIDDSRVDEFADLNDESPLFRRAMGFLQST